MRAGRVRATAPDRRVADFAGRAPDWCHAAATAARAPAEALTWSRLTFERAPLLVRAFLVVGWKLLLLDGEARSDDVHVLGWPVTHVAPDVAVLQRRSRLGIHATLLFTVLDDSIAFTSGMIFTNRVGRATWFVVAPVHRWAVRMRIGHAGRSRRD